MSYLYWYRDLQVVGTYCYFFKCFLSKMDLEILGQNPINFPHKPLEGNPQKPYANMSGPFQKLAAL